MKFKVGQKAAYPAHGVGVIKEITQIQVEDFLAEFYVLKILDNGMTIKIPVERSDANGMRSIIDKEQVEEIYEVLRDRKAPTDKQTWNRRYREYMAKIKTGDPLEVGAVLRDLALLRNNKTLSFGERKMFDQAHSLIVQEVAVAREIDEETVKNEIEEIFKS